MSSLARRFSPGILKQRRLDAGFTVTTLAAAVGVSADTLWTWERGSRQPRTEHLAALAVALLCAIDDLFEAADGEDHPHG